MNRFNADELCYRQTINGVTRDLENCAGDRELYYVCFSDLCGLQVRPGEQHIGGALGHHDNRGVRITAELVRKGRGIDHTQTFCTANPELGIEHRVRVVVGADTAGRNRVMPGGDVLA